MGERRPPEVIYGRYYYGEEVHGRFEATGRQSGHNGRDNNRLQLRQLHESSAYASRDNGRILHGLDGPQASSYEFHVHQGYAGNPQEVRSHEYRSRQPPNIRDGFHAGTSHSHHSHDNEHMYRGLGATQRYSEAPPVPSSYESRFRPNVREGFCACDTDYSSRYDDRMYGGTAVPRGYPGAPPYERSYESQFRQSPNEGTYADIGQYHHGPKLHPHHEVSEMVRPNNPSNEISREEQLLDSSLKIECGKLKHKIKSVYKDDARPLIFKNEELFEKDDWLQVWFEISNGMRKYLAEMFCPVCYKTLHPQNRSLPGRIPSWDMTTVKRHLFLLHKDDLTIKHVGGASTLEKGETSTLDKGETGENSEPVKDTDTVKGDEEASLDVELTDDKLAEDKGDKPPYNKSNANNDASESSTDEEIVARKKKPRELYAGLSSDSSSDSSSSTSDTLESSSGSSLSDSDTVVKTKRKKGVTKKCKKIAQQLKRTKPAAAQDIPDWRMPSVHFGWVKFSKSSTFLPAFIFPKNKDGVNEALQILPKGALAKTKRVVKAVATPAEAEAAKKQKRAQPYMEALKYFNAKNKTNFI